MKKEEWDTARLERLGLIACGVMVAVNLAIAIVAMTGAFSREVIEAAASGGGGANPTTSGAQSDNPQLQPVIVEVSAKAAH